MVVLELCDWELLLRHYGKPNLLFPNLPGIYLKLGINRPHKQLLSSWEVTITQQDGTEKHMDFWHTWCVWILFFTVQGNESNRGLGYSLHSVPLMDLPEKSDSYCLHFCLTSKPEIIVIWSSLPSSIVKINYSLSSFIS